MSTDNRYSVFADETTDSSEVQAKDVNLTTATPPEEPMVLGSQTETTTSTEPKSSSGETVVKDLRFLDLIHVFETSYVQKGRNNAYGNKFREETPKIRELMNKLCDLYSYYKSDEINRCLWNRIIRVFPINHCDRPYKPGTSDGAPIQSILRLLCAQIRKINEKDMLINSAMLPKGSKVGLEHVDLSAEFGCLCSDILGEQYESSGEFKIKCEPLLDELHKAINLAKEANEKNKADKEAKLNEFKAQKEARMKDKEGLQSKYSDRTPNNRPFNNTGNSNNGTSNNNGQQGSRNNGPRPGNGKSFGRSESNDQFYTKQRQNNRRPRQ